VNTAHNRSVFPVLRYRTLRMYAQEISSKKFTNCKNLMSKFVTFSDLPQNFCEKPPKILAGIILRHRGILFLSRNSRRYPCREK